MLNRERIEKGLGDLECFFFYYLCRECNIRSGSHQELTKCPRIGCGGEIECCGIEKETREVIFSNCPKCSAMCSKNAVMCQKCGAETIPVMSDEVKKKEVIESNFANLRVKSESISTN